MTNFSSSAMTWDFFKRLRDTTKMKIVIKGILAHEDAKLAADAGIDAVIVSNHGARAEDSGRSTIDALPEIIEAVGGRMPVLIDSGFRRGTDIAKALCMGARGVCIGRPYIWGLGAFGQSGVATQPLDLGPEAAGEVPDAARTHGLRCRRGAHETTPGAQASTWRLSSRRRRRP